MDDTWRASSHPRKYENLEANFETYQKSFGNFDVPWKEHKYQTL